MFLCPAKEASIVLFLLFCLFCFFFSFSIAIRWTKRTSSRNPLQRRQYLRCFSSCHISFSTIRRKRLFNPCHNNKNISFVLFLVGAGLFDPTATTDVIRTFLTFTYVLRWKVDAGKGWIERMRNECGTNLGDGYFSTYFVFFFFYFSRRIVSMRTRTQGTFAFNK